jgi:hypothetical protein
MDSILFPATRERTRTQMDGANISANSYHRATLFAASRPQTPIPSAFPRLMMSLGRYFSKLIISLFHHLISSETQ